MYSGGGVSFFDDPTQLQGWIRASAQPDGRYDEVNEIANVAIKIG